MTWVSLDRAEVRGESGEQEDILTYQAPQHHLDATDDLVQVEGLRHEYLTTAEGEEWTGPGRCAEGRRRALLAIGTYLLLAPVITQEDSGPAFDRRHAL